jgi:hypothetical protein
MVHGLREESRYRSASNEHRLAVTTLVSKQEARTERNSNIQHQETSIDPPANATSSAVELSWEIRQAGRTINGMQDGMAGRYELR